VKNIETLTLNDAKKAVSAMEERSKQLNLDLCFCVVDGTNNIILLEKMDDTKIHSINLSRAKATTAVSLKDSTRNVHKLILELKIEPSYWAGACETGFKGGIPVYFKPDSKNPMGAIGVSGATQEQDEEIALIGLKAMGYLTK
jgi:uncharacterized protein GlcG (DUF336 family)